MSLRTILVVWFVVSFVFATVWSLCGMAYERRLAEADALAEAERIIDAESLRVWGP